MQYTIDCQGLNIDDVCKRFQVSSATVRNWLKVGELKFNEWGNIDSNSVDIFQQKIIGTSKLSKRANKLSKTQIDTQISKENLLKELVAGMLDPEQASVDYQNLLTDVEKNKEGIYYTPNYIIDDMLKNISEIDDRTFCDPCCGSGNFIIKAIKLGINPKNIYGFDTDPIAVMIAKARFKKITGVDDDNQIQCMDFLEYSYKNSNVHYDCIYTNPPWGKKFTKNQKMDFAKEFQLSNDLVNDSCSLFFAICVRHLSANGALGFLLPDAVFNIGVYEPMRSLALSLGIVRLCDYGKPFKGLQTGAVFIELNQNINQDIICESENKSWARNKESFLKNPKKILNIHCSPQESRVIEHIYCQPHTLLNNDIEWGLGIVTGNNAKHLKSVADNNSIAVYRGSDILKNKLKEPTHFIDKDFSKYQQVAPLTLYQSKEKLIYRFISSKLIFYYDDKQSFVLNSANMLVPNENFQYSLKLLADILNSDLMNWLFQKLFNAHKVLKSDLICLPIHFDFFDNGIFCEQKYLTCLNLECHNGTYRVKE